MKKHVLFIIIFLIITTGHIYSQSTYSGNVSVTDDSFFRGFTKDSSNYFLGGCNAFPIGTYVNVKLPYSEDSVYVKIVSRIPEDGIFILIDKEAGEKLGLNTNDVLPVQIQVKSFTPPPLKDLDTSDELNPEPEIKGLTSKNMEEEAEEVPPVTTYIEEEVESAIEDESEEIITDNEKSADIEDKPIAIEPTEELLKEVIEVDKAKKESGITEDSETFKDELPEDSIFDEVDDKLLDDEVETVKVEDVDREKKKVKRIYFLEPATNKPPVGGIPDEDLLPVTPVDDNLILESGYYLQVGIYRDENNIERDSRKLEKLNFPFIAVKDHSEVDRERLLVGPVNNDELGVIMLNLKNRGFKDFFRYKNNSDD